MKRYLYFIGLIISILVTASCVPEKEVRVHFKDMTDTTIYDYIVKYQDQYSEFLELLKVAKLDQTLSAYNTESNLNGYTLFLPDNAAIDAFLATNGTYNSFDELIRDTAYVSQFCRYHVVNDKIDANDFNMGPMSSYTLTEDYLAVSFVVETDTAYYKINNEAPVKRTNIEMCNGFIHLISVALNPIAFTTYQWLERNPGYSIFKNAVDITGLKSLLNVNTKTTPTALKNTLFVEHDSVFHKIGIYSINDLIARVSPGNNNYTNTLNPLYNFVAYHVLTDYKFVEEFQAANTNYPTFSDIPLSIDGKGTFIKINKWKQVYDTLIVDNDTTYIDYIQLNYDRGNELTTTGIIQFIDQVMTQVAPSRADVSFSFFEEPYFNAIRNDKVLGIYPILDSSILKTIDYSGVDLNFNLVDPENTNAWNGDYLYVDGDFVISYSIPKIVQGTYTFYLGADAFDEEDAMVDVYIDGIKLNTIDLFNSGGTAQTPFQGVEIGEVTFTKYQAHKITVKSLIPGKFYWDYVRFEPVK